MAPRRGRPPWWAWLLIAIAAGGIVALVLAIVFTVTGLARTTPEPAVAPPMLDGPPALETGAEQQPEAAEPLECSSPCLDPDEVDVLVPTEEEMEAIGLLAQPGWSPSSSDALSEFRYAHDYWVAEGAEPGECLFANSSSPLSESVDDPMPPSDRIRFSFVHTDYSGWYYLTAQVRYFESSEAAAAHLVDLAEAIDGCRAYVVPMEDWTWAPRVTAAPQLDVPDSVAAIGFVADMNGERLYATDLLRGDVVIRVVASTDAWAIPEADYRTIVESLADRLAEVPLAPPPLPT